MRRGARRRSAIGSGDRRDARSAGAAGGADAAPGRRLQRAARPRRRGRHDPGRARDAAHSLHPFGRARLGGRDGQADGEDALRRRRPAGRRRASCSCARRARRGRSDAARRLSSSRSTKARASACASCAAATIRGARRSRTGRLATRCMVERYVPGREITVAVMGERALGVLEIVPRGTLLRLHREIRAGRLRPSDPGADPRRGPMTRRSTSRSRAHRALGCRGVSRADLRYDDTAGEPGRMVLLEVNTQPGMTPTSLVPGHRASCRHRLCRAGALDGGERGMRWLNAARPPATACRGAGARWRTPAPARAIVGGGVAVAARRRRRRRACSSRRGPDAAAAPVAAQRADRASAALGFAVADVAVEGREHDRPRDDPRRARRHARHADPRRRPGARQGAARSAALGALGRGSSGACPTRSSSAWSSASRSPSGSTTASSC